VRFVESGFLKYEITTSDTIKSFKILYQNFPSYSILIRRFFQDVPCLVDFFFHGASEDFSRESYMVPNKHILDWLATEEKINRLPRSWHFLGVLDIDTAVGQSHGHS
jgi:hypothetical protein